MNRIDAMSIPSNARVATTEEFRKLMKITKEPLRVFTESNESLDYFKRVYRTQSGEFFASEEIKPCGYGTRTEYHVFSLA